jgi:hypothetical protein
MVPQVPLVPPGPTVPQETEEFPGCRGQLVLSAPGAPPDLRGREEWPVLLGRRDRQVRLDPRDLPDLWAPEVSEERRGHLGSLELQVWEAGLVTRDLLARLDLSALRALQDFRGHPGSLVRPGTLERGESEAPVDHQG